MLRLAPLLLASTAAALSFPLSVRRAPTLMMSDGVLARDVSTRLVFCDVGSQATAQKMDERLEACESLVAAVPGLVDTQRTLEKADGGKLMYKWEATFEDVNALSDFMKSEVQKTQLAPVFEAAMEDLTAPPAAAAPAPPAAPAGPSSLPGPLADVLSKAGLADPTSLPASERDEVLGAAAAGAILLFLLPLFDIAGFLGDLALSALLGGGALGYLSLRPDTSATARQLGGLTVKAVEKAGPALEQVAAKVKGFL